MTTRVAMMTTSVAIVSSFCGAYNFSCDAKTFSRHSRYDQRRDVPISLQRGCRLDKRFTVFFWAAIDASMRLNDASDGCFPQRPSDEMCICIFMVGRD
jgi:hypothetical protein